jgi:hypothetical protein
MKWLARLGISLAMIGVVAPSLSAQTTGKIAAGLGISTMLAGDEAARGAKSLGFFFRFGHGREGFGWKYGLNWYSAELDRQVGGGYREFGRIRIRPLLGGYGYTHLMGKTNISAGVMGGYAFTSFSRRDSFDLAYVASHGVVVTKTSSSNAFVLRPEVSVWHDLNKKVGLNITGGYIFARPEVTVTSSLGQDRQRVRADMFTLRMGLVYSIF